MSVYRRFNGKKSKDKGIWQVEFKLRGYHIKQSIPEARTKEQAVQVETQLRQAIFDGKYNKDSGKEKFKDFVDLIYLPWARDNKKSYSHDEFRAEVLKTYFKDKLLRDFTPMLIETFKHHRLQTTTVRKDADSGENKPRSAASVNRELQLLSKIFSMAYDNGLVDSNPMRRVKLLKETGRRERFLTYDEEKLLVPKLSGRLAYLKPIVTVALHTGMRRGEILAMKWADVDFQSGTIFIPVSKSGKPRIVPFNHTV
jgi:integrase